MYLQSNSSPSLYLRPGTWVRDYFEVMGCSLALDAHIYPSRFYLYRLELEIPKSHGMLLSIGCSQLPRYNIYGLKLEPRNYFKNIGCFSALDAHIYLGIWIIVRDYFEVMGCSSALDAHIFLGIWIIVRDYCKVVGCSLALDAHIYLSWYLFIRIRARDYFEVIGCFLAWDAHICLSTLSEQSIETLFLKDALGCS